MFKRENRQQQEPSALVAGSDAVVDTEPGESKQPPPDDAQVNAQATTEGQQSQTDAAAEGAAGEDPEVTVNVAEIMMERALKHGIQTRVEGQDNLGFLLCTREGHCIRAQRMQWRTVYIVDIKPGDQLSILNLTDKQDEEYFEVSAEEAQLNIPKQPAG